MSNSNISENDSNNNDNRKGWFKFERKNLDFPFYNNNPHISKLKWIILLIVPFALSWIPSLPYEIHSLLILIITLICFGFIANWDYGLVFKKLQKNDLILIIVIAVLMLILGIVTSQIADILGIVSHSNSAVNPASIWFWLKLPFQLLFEEFLKLAPFLAVLALFYQTTKNRKLSIIIATIVACVYFALIHVSNYGSVLNVLLTISIPSLLNVFGYIKTKNIWVAFLIHLLYDIIGVALMG